MEVLISAPRPSSTQQPTNSSVGSLRPNNQEERNTIPLIKEKRKKERKMRWKKKYVTDEGVR